MNGPALPDLYPGFAERVFETGETSIFARIGGNGPPLALLHGFPETHACWHHIAPRLAEHFTCVLPDLRGYGASGCPPDAPDHSTYSKRAMARDILAVMQALGHDRFGLVGHDRGARVAYRLTLDSPGSVERLGIIEIVPTYDMWERLSVPLAHRAYHWLFLARPSPLPERLIGGDAVFFLEHTLASWAKAGDLSAFDERALAHYRAMILNPERVHAMCEDYRAGASADYEADRGDRAAGRRIACPVHVVYGASGFPAAAGGPLKIWRDWAERVEATAIDSGHFAPEENPLAVLSALLPFLQGKAR